MVVWACLNEDSGQNKKDKRQKRQSEDTYMRGTILSGLAGGLLLMTGSSSFAIQYTDVQQVNQTVSVFDSYFGTFNIVSPGSSSYTISGFAAGNGTFADAGGYVLGTPLSSVTASFYIYAPLLGFFDTVNVDLNGLQVVNDGGALSWSWAKDFTVNGNNGVLSILEKDGEVSYEVSSDSGFFTLEYALLQASTGSSTGGNGDPVPDGGVTVGLLGLGLIGVALVRRKFAATR